MKVLVVGSGGREHALVWKIAQSSKVSQIFCAPGNGGTATIAQNVPIKELDIEGLAKFAEENAIDLTVVGPEAPLMAGIVDYFKERGLKIFGPRLEAARLEGSKVFAKKFMQEYGIPTASFIVCSSQEECERLVKGKPFPYVLKVDGLAAGKGAIVVNDEISLRQAINAIWVERQFGSAADQVIIEDFLYGEEASILVVTDGKDYVILPAAQDHKRVFDNDQGPNTGGMGAYAPAPLVSPEVIEKVEIRIIRPVLEGMRRKGTPYTGVLYCGLMINDGEPAVVEFNSRFGDPETQAVLPIIESDFAELLLYAADGSLADYKLSLAGRFAVCVVLASGGYPGSYRKGFEIRGLGDVRGEDVYVFHAGTELRENRYYTNGGRVLGVTAWAGTLREAVEKAYRYVDLIDFEHKHYRRDIAQKGLKLLFENQ